MEDAELLEMNLIKFLSFAKQGLSFYDLNRIIL